MVSLIPSELAREDIGLSSLIKEYMTAMIFQIDYSDYFHILYTGGGDRL